MMIVNSIFRFRHSRFRFSLFRSRWHCTKSFTICFITWAISRPCELCTVFFYAYISFREFQLITVVCVGAECMYFFLSSSIVLMTSLNHTQIFIQFKLLCTLVMPFSFSVDAKKINFICKKKYCKIPFLTLIIIFQYSK